MNRLFKTFICLLASFFMATGAFANANQTDTTSTILPESSLPFSIVIEQTNFHLPVGLHSGVVGVYKGLWVFIAGRMNGLHGFGPDPFPPDQQNTSIYVVNPATGATSSRSLSDPRSGLNQQQIDSLSVTTPEGFQSNNTLYMTGGYGIDTASGTFTTKPILTAINLPGIIQWVTQPNNRRITAAQQIRQLYNPIFQIAGGRMFNAGSGMLLIFGQDQEGVYTDATNGIYSEQVRRFQIGSSGGQLTVNILPSTPGIQDPNLRRRDLNVLPVLYNANNQLKFGMVAYAGVFTPQTGVWTVPVLIDENGNPNMPDPNSPTTFKQGMNQYNCATVGLYSNKTANMYNIFFGGISYGFYSNGQFETDSEIPFINQVTTIQMDRNGNFTQYLMNNQYPTILSTQSNPGNTLLFGAEAYFIPNQLVMSYPNSVINLDSIRQPTVIGYIVGGIQSTLPNTNFDSDSAASPYIFKVTLIPK